MVYVIPYSNPAAVGIENLRTLLVRFEKEIYIDQSGVRRSETEQQHAPQRSHDSRQYGTRFMLRLDDASVAKLDALTQVFVTSRADVIRQLIMQATPKVFPKSWHLAAQERRQRQAREADASKARRS